MAAFPLPDPQLRDERVVLRPWRDADVTVLARWAKDPEIVRWTAITPGYDVEHAKAFRVHAHRERITGNAVYLAIAEAATGVTVGSCDLRRPVPDDASVGEVGYLLGPEGRGSGFATSAVVLLARYGIGVLGMSRIQALVHPDNAPSLRVLARAGFREEGVLRAYRPGHDGREDRIMLSVLPGET